MKVHISTTALVEILKGNLTATEAIELVKRDQHCGISVARVYVENLEKAVKNFNRLEAIRAVFYMYGGNGHLREAKDLVDGNGVFQRIEKIDNTGDSVKALRLLDQLRSAGLRIELTIQQREGIAAPTDYTVRCDGEEAVETTLLEAVMVVHSKLRSSR